MNPQKILILLSLFALRVTASGSATERVHFTASVGNPEGKIGSEMVFTLRFANETKKPVRIYLVRSEYFRALQSDLRVTRASDGKVVDVQPLPRPHGYVVDESDFHLIPPGESFSVTQSLWLDASRFKVGEKYTVTWIYENSVRRWPGGIPTVEGRTKELFGGDEIPYIWVGRSDVEVRIRVRK